MHAQRNFLQRGDELEIDRSVVHGIRVDDEQHLDFAARHLLRELREAGVSDVKKIETNLKETLKAHRTHPEIRSVIENSSGGWLDLDRINDYEWSPNEAGGAARGMARHARRSARHVARRADRRTGRRCRQRTQVLNVVKLDPGHLRESGRRQLSGQQRT